MAIDMKKTIAEAASNLLFEKKVKKLTVKDIVEECHITRQAFYYHFEDIPDLIHWVLYQETEVVLEECIAQQDLEKGFAIFLRLRFSFSLMQSAVCSPTMVTRSDVCWSRFFMICLRK